MDDDAAIGPASAIAADADGAHFSWEARYQRSWDAIREDAQGKRFFMFKTLKRKLDRNLNSISRQARWTPSGCGARSSAIACVGSGGGVWASASSGAEKVRKKMKWKEKNCRCSAACCASCCSSSTARAPCRTRI